MANIWPTGRAMASLVYASSRQSDGPPIPYPPTASAVAAGTAMISQPLRRREDPGRRGGASAGPGAVSSGRGANVVAGSSGPMSVSATVVLPGRRLQTRRAPASGYPAATRGTATVNVLLILG